MMTLLVSPHIEKESESLVIVTHRVTGWVVRQALTMLHILN